MNLGLAAILMIVFMVVLALFIRRARRLARENYVSMREARYDRLVNDLVEGMDEESRRDWDSK